MRTKRSVTQLDPGSNRHAGVFVVVETENSVHFLLGDGRGMRILLKGDYGLVRHVVMVGEPMDYFNPSGVPSRTGARVKQISVYDQPLLLNISVPRGMQRDVKGMLAQLTGLPREVIKVEAEQ